MYLSVGVVIRRCAVCPRIGARVFHADTTRYASGRHADTDAARYTAGADFDVCLRNWGAADAAGHVAEAEVTLNSRDVQQVASLVVCLFGLVVIVYKARAHISYPFVLPIFYFPIFIIFAIVAIYYFIAFYDTKVFDIINSSDWSATVRMLSMVLLLIVVSIQPPRARKW
jgi:hypothetical protein